MSMTEIERDRDIADLLPFYVSGTLGYADRKRVEAELARNAALRHELEVVREEQDETIRFNESLPVPSGKAAQKLFAAIDAEPRSQVLPKRIDLVRWFGEKVAQLSPRTLGWTAAAAVAVLAVQAGTFGSIMTGHSPFRTAAHVESAPVAGTYATIAFAPKATADDIAALLQSYNATIVEGPKAGIFKIRIGSDVLASADRDRILGEMRAKGDVIRFAAPAAN